MLIIYLLVSFDFGYKWYEIDTSKDVNVNYSIEAIDTDCRRSGHYKTSLPGKVDMSVDADMFFDKNDNVFRALELCATGGGIFRLCALTEEGNGPDFYAHITDFSRNESLSSLISCQAKYSVVEFNHWWKDKLDDTGTPYHPLSSNSLGVPYLSKNHLEDIVFANYYTLRLNPSTYEFSVLVKQRRDF